MSKPSSFFLIDDDADDRELFEEILNQVSPGIRFQSAEDGNEALLKLRSPDFALPTIIFLDLNMPVKDGKACLKDLKSDARLRHIPVIIYSTSSLSKDIEETMLNGAACFITKPTRTADIKNILYTLSTAVPNNIGNAIQQLTESKNIFVIS